MELKESRTYQNLARAFAGESQARNRYAFIEYGARKEGYKALAALIDQIAFNEFTHARMFYSFLQTADKKPIDNIDIDAGYPFREKWDLTENLAFAAQDEQDEAQRIYPEFAAIAREEGFANIAKLFENVTEVEKRHHKIFKELHEQMKNGTMYKKSRPVVWKCPECGYEEKGTEAFAVCPLCQAKQGAVELHLDI